MLDPPQPQVDKQDRVNSFLDSARKDGGMPGAVWAVGDPSGTLWTGSCGTFLGSNAERSPEQANAPMTTRTVFDIASLTKIVAVWAAIGSLWSEKQLSLDTTLQSVFGRTIHPTMRDVTVRNLLTHTAGLPPRANLRELYGADPSRIREGVLNTALDGPPDQQVRYTDRAALILGYVIESIEGRGLDLVSDSRVWQPLGMHTTRFGPLRKSMERQTAPTEWDDSTLTFLQGRPHDFSARLLGGVCGIAGVFTDVNDLGILLTAMGGEAVDQLPWLGAWMQESLRPLAGELDTTRGLFWHPAPGYEQDLDIWAHHGFTGTAMWFSPQTGRWAVLLTNKIVYTREREPIGSIRAGFARLVMT